MCGLGLTCDCGGPGRDTSVDPHAFMRAEARNRVLEARLTFCLPIKPWKTMIPDVPIYDGMEYGNGASASSAPANVCD
jgi:hypothetical protein